MNIGKRTGLALSTYKKLYEAFQEIEKGDLEKTRREVMVAIIEAFFRR